MIEIIKKTGKDTYAYKLGEDDEMITKLIKEGKIKALQDGRYEIFSQEAVHGQSGRGEVAKAGDFIKIDSAGFPYPNASEFFLKKHRQIGENLYEQIPEPLYAWTADQPMCPEVEFLMEHKGLVLNTEDENAYFKAVLWGTLEAAAKDAVLVFYSVDYVDGKVVDADFNFVSRVEFNKCYRILF